jgi:hypothetical protein
MESLLSSGDRDVKQIVEVIDSLESMEAQQRGQAAEETALFESEKSSY